MCRAMAIGGGTGRKISFAALLCAPLVLAACGEEPLATPEPRGVIRTSESQTAPAAPAGPISEIFIPQMLGARLAYLEHHYGPAMKILDPEDPYSRLSAGLEERLYRIAGCEVVIGAEGEEIVSMSLDLSETCTFDLGPFLQGVTSSANALTFGEVAEAYADGRFLADCLADCGNAADPSVYMTVIGPSADDGRVAILEAKLAGEDAAGAASQWREAMVEGEGADYVALGRYNCGSRYDGVAREAFADISPTRITLTTAEGRLRPQC